MAGLGPGAWKLAYSSALNTGYIQVYNRDSAAWGTLYLGNGHVGIGTESPDYSLHVETSGSRAIYGRSTASTGYGVYGEATGTTSQNYGGFFQADGAHGRGVYCWASHTSGTNFALKASTSSPDGFAGYFSGGRNYFEGNVGIGIESPAARLQVEGNADVDPLRVRVDGTTMFSVKRNGRTNVGSNALPAFQLEVSGEGTAGKPGGGSWSSSSDRRLKKNIRDLEGSLDRLLQLRSVTFEYKDPEVINELPGKRIGMIAQEVEEVFPDWVDVGGHGYKILTFRGFEALAVDALRELPRRKGPTTAREGAADRTTRASANTNARASRTLGEHVDFRERGHPVKRIADIGPAVVWGAHEPRASSGRREAGILVRR